MEKLVIYFQLYNLQQSLDCPDASETTLYNMINDERSWWVHQNV